LENFFSKGEKCTFSCYYVSYLQKTDTESYSEPVESSTHTKVLIHPLYYSVSNMSTRSFLLCYLIRI